MTKPSPTTVYEWISLMDFLLASDGDAEKIKQELREIEDPTKAMECFGWNGGMTIRNATGLWGNGVAAVLAEDVKRIQRTYRIPLLETKITTDEWEPKGVDSRLSHPDNLSWVLVTLYVDYLQGRLKFPTIYPV